MECSLRKTFHTNVTSSSTVHTFTLYTS